MGGPICLVDMCDPRLKVGRVGNRTWPKKGIMERDMAKKRKRDIDKKGGLGACYGQTK